MNNEHGINMDNNLNLSSTNIANPLSNAAPTASAGVDDSLSTPMNGKEFAGLMRDLLSQSGRQELAASGVEGSELEADTKCSEAPATGLLTLNLGDQFAVITTTSPLPDGNSLAAFARAQGLGESAVKALFGDLIAMPSDALMASPSLLSVGSAIDPQLANAPATFNWLSAHPGALPNVPQVASAVMSQYADMTLDSQALAPENTSKVSNLDKLLTATGATAVIQALGIATRLGGLAPTATLTAAELHAEMGPLDAMRMRLVPAWETMTQQLAKLNGNLKGTTWAELMSTKLAEKSPMGESTSTLNLGSTDIGLDLGADLTLAMAAGASDNVSATPLNASDNTKAPVSLSAIANSSLTAQGEKAEMADRAEQIQQLANKLGQALGERLQEQMERGQWRLHLKLNPGHLGQIDVELDMRAGGLDAIFRTENMLTKELILQGASKLKESLAQSGTTVADVWVNSDSKRQSGGNPTPQRFTDNSDTEPESKVNQPPQRANTLIEKRSADAWDTLA
jgi:flagellar hook-length control protein FliK